MSVQLTKPDGNADFVPRTALSAACFDGQGCPSVCIFSEEKEYMKNQTFMKGVFVGSVLLFAGCGGKMPENLGVIDNHLLACPSTPNCVSSLEGEDKEHSVDPLTYSGELAGARQRMLDVIRSMKRTKIITADERYIHVEFRSGLFRFVDDVEFYFGDDPGIIQVRSASRIGRSDLGVNRKRIEVIRERYAQQ